MSERSLRSEGGTLRVDAERNRARILAAAAEAFAERGCHAVPMEEIARLAGVGVGTLYRRFPTRDALIAGVFEAKMSAYAEAVEEALAETDAWAAFCRYVERVCEMQAADRGFADVLTLTFPTAPAVEAARLRAYDGFVELVRRAKRAKRLRRDFVPEDLVVLLMANAGVVSATGDTAPGTWRRLVRYALQAFAAPAAGPLPDPPDPGLLHLAMLRMQPDRQG